jgi:glucose-1-phosphate adenylyltransferase
MPDKLNSGITVIGEGTSIPAGKKIGRNVLISTFVLDEDFPEGHINSGETITKSA